MKATTLALACLALVVLAAIAHAACPSNCSGHGTCNGNVCACNQYYTGADCSIYERDISPEQTLSNTIPTHQWQYYKFTLTTPIAKLNFSVHERTPGDSDIYVKFGAYPRRDSYDAADVTRSTDYSVKIDNPSVGVWYAGIYGFYSCEYDIVLHTPTTNVCPSGCSNHGTCNANGTCTCNQFWTGDSCAQEVTQLKHRESRLGSVSQGQWVFYYVNIAEGQNEMRIIVNESSTTGDSDLYIQFNELPSLWNFLYRDSTLNHNYSLTIDNTRVGTYYIGVFGYKPTAYNITALFGSLEVCPNRCSDHGDCRGRTCQCRSGFSGDDCENMDANLALDQWVSGFVRDNSWNYYHIRADTAANLIVKVHQEAHGDCDLYIKSGSKPSRFDYDMRDVSFNTDFELTVENPQDQTWYIGVFGYQECQYQIRATTSLSACPAQCSGHGDCIQGRCACRSGYAGDDCASPLHRLTNGEARTGDSVTMNQWQYYKFEVGMNGGYMMAEALETNTTGNVWLYVNQAAPPTLTDYDYSNTKLDTANHVIYFPIKPSMQPQHYYIGVYGDPISQLEHPVAYTIVAYSPQL